MGKSSAAISGDSKPISNMNDTALVPLIVSIYTYGYNLKKSHNKKVFKK